MKVIIHPNILYIIVHQIFSMLNIRHPNENFLELRSQVNKIKESEGDLVLYKLNILGNTNMRILSEAIVINKWKKTLKENSLLPKFLDEYNRLLEANTDKLNKDELELFLAYHDILTREEELPSI